jgi:hypothetical protein
VRVCRIGCSVPAARRKGDEMLQLAATHTSIDLHLALPGLIAIGVGVLILIFPKILNYLVAAYLIIVGVIEIFNLHI